MKNQKTKKLHLSLQTTREEEIRGMADVIADTLGWDFGGPRLDNPEIIDIIETEEDAIHRTFIRGEDGKLVMVTA